MLSKLLILLSFVLASAIMPLHANEKLYEAGKVVCPTNDEGKDFGYCTYTLINLTKAQSLIKKVEQTLFLGDPLSPPVGILEPLGNNQKVVTFWHKDAVVLDKMKQLIPMLDTRESFATNSIIEVKTDIYEVTESGLSNLSAEISNLRIGSGLDDIVSGSGVSADSNGLGLDLKIGVFQLKGLLAAERSKGTLKRKASITRAVPNLSSIEYSDVTPVYAAPGAGTQVMTSEAGIKLQGTVSLNDENQSLVNIKDYKLNYGVIDSEGRVNMVTLPYSNLVLEEGISFPLVSSKSVGQIRTTSYGLFGFGRSVEVEDTKLLVYTSVKVYSWDDYVRSVKKLLDVGKQRFDKDELDQLPITCINDLDLLNDIELIAKRDLSGDPILSFRLRKENACVKNIKKRLYVRISGAGIPRNSNEHYMTVERAMHIPIKINDIKLSNFRLPLLQFKVKMEIRGRQFSRAFHYLKFAPTAHDIVDSFWEE
jgi:hypothetical protein